MNCGAWFNVKELDSSLRERQIEKARERERERERDIVSFSRSSE
jgi:hypothetical protein